MVVLYGEVDYFLNNHGEEIQAAYYYGIVINNPKLRSIIDSYAYIDDKTKVVRSQAPINLR